MIDTTKKYIMFVTSELHLVEKATVFFYVSHIIDAGVVFIEAVLLQEKLNRDVLSTGRAGERNEQVMLFITLSFQL